MRLHKPGLFHVINVEMFARIILVLKINLSKSKISVLYRAPKQL